MKKNYRQRIDYDEVYDLCCEALRNGPGIVKVVCPDNRDPSSFMASFNRYLKHNDHDQVSLSAWNGDLLIVSDNVVCTFVEDKAKTLREMANECFEYAVENGACRILFHDRYASTFKTRSLEMEKGSIVFCKRGETVYVFDEEKIPTVDAVYVGKSDNINQEKRGNELLTKKLRKTLLLSHDLNISVGKLRKELEEKDKKIDELTKQLEEERAKTAREKRWNAFLTKEEDK